MPQTQVSHSIHTPHNAWLIPRRGNGCNRFFWQSPIYLFFRQIPIYLVRLPELSVPRSGTGKGTTRSLVIMHNKNLRHRELEGRLLWLKRRGTRGWKSRRSLAQANDLATRGKLQSESARTRGVSVMTVHRGRKAPGPRPP